MMADSNGIYTGLPFLLQFFGKITFSHIAELLIAKEILSRDATSRIFTVISLVGVGFFLIVTTFVACNHTALAIFMICLAMTVYSANGPGYLHSQLAICPPFRGIMSAIVNIMGTVSQLCVPYVVNLIVVNNTVQEWRTVFVIGFAGQIFAATIYCFFGSAQEQSWSYQCLKKDKNALKWLASKWPPPNWLAFKRPDAEMADAKMAALILSTPLPSTFPSRIPQNFIFLFYS
uniref:Uncharacterized protein n=1 Tax=Romanomermis culicivorax TaxID=13658 RepID=A0A915L8P1_ROMCU